MKKYRISAAIMAMMIGVASIGGNGLRVSAAEASENTALQAVLAPIGGKIYYVYQDGSFARGWLMIGTDWYFFSPADGAMAMDTVINGFKFGADGRFAGIEVLEEQAQEKETAVKNQTLKDVADYFLSSIITEGMSEDEKIRACYTYIMDITEYERTYETPSGDWTGDFALQLLTSGKGNCYRYAAAFAYLVTGLGYEAKVSTGEIASRKGGTAPHGWAEVKIGDAWYIYDPDMEDANRAKDYYKKTYENYPVRPLVKKNEWAVSF